MSGRKETTLGTVASLVTDKVSAAEITTYNYISTDNMLPNLGGVSPATSIPAAKKFNLYKENDTLFSNIRTYFKKVWKADRSGGASADVLIFRVKDSKVLNPDFLYYLMSNQVFIDYTVLTSKGVKMPRGDKEAMFRYPLYLPDILEQRAVAEILGALDDKIELNQRMNETLEAMARALFKSWFVDFDPVRAKAEGRAPEGMDAATAALFPAAFNDDGLPEGWGEKLVGDAVDTISKTYPLKTVSEVIFLNTGDIQNGKFLHSNKSDTSSLPGQAKKSIQKGDILYSEIRPENKRYAFVYFDTSEYVVSTKLMVLRASSDISSLFIYFVLKQQSNIDWLQMMAESRSGTFPQITYDVLSRVTYMGPSDKRIIGVFTERVLEPLYQKIIANDKEAEQLANLRDVLLPKLISGELRIDEAAPFRKEAAG